MDLQIQHSLENKDVLIRTKVAKVFLRADTNAVSLFKDAVESSNDYSENLARTTIRTGWWRQQETKISSKLCQLLVFYESETRFGLNVRIIREHPWNPSTARVDWVGELNPAGFDDLNSYFDHLAGVLRRPTK